MREAAACELRPLNLNVALITALALACIMALTVPGCQEKATSTSLKYPSLAKKICRSHFLRQGSQNILQFRLSYVPRSTVL